MKIDRLYLAPYEDPGVNDLRVHVCNKLNELIDANNREEKPEVIWGEPLRKSDPPKREEKPEDDEDAIVRMWEKTDGMSKPKREEKLPQSCEKCYQAGGGFGGCIHYAIASTDPPKPTACCDCLPGKIGIYPNSDHTASKCKCSCHQPASKCLCKQPTNQDPIGRWNPNCPVHAPHETPTKTCTCPHCDYARCDRWDHV